MALFDERIGNQDQQKHGYPNAAHVCFHTHYKAEKITEKHSGQEACGEKCHSVDDYVLFSKSEVVGQYACREFGRAAIPYPPRRAARVHL